MAGLDFLKKAAKKTETAPKKDEMPVLELANTEDNQKALKDWLENKKKETAAETLRKQKETILRSQCEKARADYCLTNNKFHSSIKVKAGEVGPVVFVTQDRYSKIPPDKEDELRKEFGDNYEKCFGLKTEIALTEKAMKEIEKTKEGEKGLLDKLVEAVGGPEKFNEYFTVEQSIEPTETMHMNRVLDPKIRDAAKAAIDKQILKPTTPSFRT